ncbi:MAG: FixH family protein [Anaerolineales bacterium]|nr:FixH family protein [Anaerolineales bacterium]
MRKMIFVSMIVGLTVLLAACGGSAPAEETASSKDVNIVVASNPSPAMVGDVELQLTITDANGNPIEGAKVDVGADHPAMAGMGMSGLATEQGGGKYSIKANFSDPGDWKLTIYVRKGELDYKEEFEFPVQ